MRTTLAALLMMYCLTADANVPDHLGDRTVSAVAISLCGETRYIIINLDSLTYLIRDRDLDDDEDAREFLRSVVELMRARNITPRTIYLDREFKAYGIKCASL